MEIAKVDIIIIGAGPIGLNCAIEAHKNGLRAIVLEKGVIVNSIYNYPTNMTFFSTSKLLEIGGVPFVSHNDKPTRTEALEYYRRVVDSWKIDVRTYTEAQSMKRNADDSYIIRTNRESFESTHCIITTGFFDTPRLLNIPGEQLPKVKHYYDDAHPYVKQKILVIGAANSACDVALEGFYKGAEVTMAIRGDSIYKGVKYWIRPNIENRIKEGSIAAYFSSEVEEITEHEVVLKTPDGKVRLENDFVMAMTGYKPNYALFKRLGLAIKDDKDQTPVHDSETLETNLPNVYVAGVINAGLATSTLFIENTRVHAKMILKAIRKKAKPAISIT